MLRVIFDTNVYGNLPQEKDFVDLKAKIVADEEFVVYGYGPIRQEIRNIPRVTTFSRKARNALLTLYDNITGNHFLEHSLAITHLAKKYYDYYRKEGGLYNWDTSIRIDFMIVACASMNKLDVVYSADSKTMLSKPAFRAYRHINIKENLKTPNFFEYSLLLQKFRD